MKEWLISALKTVLAQKFPLLLASLSPLLAGVFLFFHGVIAPHLSDPTGWLALKAIALAASLLPLPFVAYFWFRPKFKHLPFGLHENIKTGAYFCSQCLIKDKLHSPLYQLPDGSRWRCRVCNASINDPSFVYTPKTPVANPYLNL